MRLSRFFLPLLRETPKEAEIVSHQLMLRAGMVRQASAGIYSWLPLGYRVLLAEYPGYGARKGELSEETFVRDAKETLRVASERYGGPLYLLGESLGCAVAAAAAKDSPVEIDGLILITPWEKRGAWASRRRS